MSVTLPCKPLWHWPAGRPARQCQSGLQGSGLRACSARQQPITDAGFGDNIFGLSRIGFQLLPQMPHIHPQVMPAFDKGRAPDFDQQLPLRHYPASIAHQHCQQAVFSLGQMHLFVVTVNDTLGQINLDLAKFKTRAAVVVLRE